MPRASTCWGLGCTQTRPARPKTVLFKPGITVDSLLETSHSSGPGRISRVDTAPGSLRSRATTERSDVLYEPDTYFAEFEVYLREIARMVASPRPRSCFTRIKTIQFMQAYICPMQLLQGVGEQISKSWPEIFTARDSRLPDHCHLSDD